MNKYFVKFFDRLDWEHKSGYCLAKSEKELREYIDSKINQEFRQTVTYSKEKESVDSLTIELIEANIPIPYFLEGSDVFF